MITVQQARDNYKINIPTIEGIIGQADRTIKSRSKAGYGYCKPFEYYRFRYDETFLKEEWDKKDKEIIHSRIKQVNKYLTQLGYSVHVPKRLFSRKPKYEETIIRW